ncbi:unnamed protein product [Rhizoctonia solani]|uniref:Zn(2)-C6 fungal-type domain-containing protein n=1 Tax=Rhizoctonia solani TaxID=456999 RepID=A0A8H3A819_9AGAM|nr:unnamed protein product [Rhizoctonia solani]
MSRHSRSTTGCAACKFKRRKCDEGKPQCLRCVSSGTSCNYEYIKVPEKSAYLVPRTETARRSAFSRLNKATGKALENSRPAAASFTASASETPALSVDPTSSGIRNYRALLGPTTMAYCDKMVNDTAKLSSSSWNPRSYQVQHPSVPTQVVFGVSNGAFHRTFDRVSKEPTYFINTDSDSANDHNLELEQILLYINPAMDKNVKQNTLPFVLQCYSRWALASVFEPLKAVHIMKDRIAEHFSLEDTRSKTILAANVMRIYMDNNLSIGPTGTAIVASLVSNVQKQVRSFLVATPSSAMASDNKNATHILENTLEIFALQMGAQSSLACVLSMDEIALVVQRACCEPSGKLLSLSNILLSPSLNLRHFATLDILRSAVTGRPTYFKYEAQFSSTQYDQIFSQHDYGLQWFYGFPDHFVMIFAWINSLRGIEGAGANAALISQVEMEVQRAETVLGQSDDPALRVGRTVVHECWRNAALIYLYMALCGAAANDPRVLRVVKNVTRLIKGAKSGHMPDAYLTPPITIVGLAAYREQDRYVVQQRMLNIVKCAKSKVVAKDLLLQLEDVWTRTRNEKRAAVWSDLRIAYLNVVGI